MKKPAGGGTTNKAPVILAQTFIIDDNSGAGAVVGTVAASDPEGVQLTYTLSGNDAPFFMIDPYGVIRFSSTFAGPLDPGGYDLTVSVSDGKSTSTAPVTVNVGEVIDLGNLSPEDGFSIIGPDGSGIGWQVASAGDVNNDGVADFMVTAGNQSDVYVVFGDSNRDASGNYADIDLADAITWDGFALIRGTTGLGLGESIAPAGDVNGDGIDDLLVSAIHDLRQTDIVIFGRDSTSGETFPDVYNLPDAQSLQDFAASGAGVLISGGSFYMPVSAGDINGDGVGDLIIGDAGYDAGSGKNNDSVGAAWVVYGPTTTNVDLTDLSGTSWEGLRILGSSRLEQVGFAVDSAGDINGDGLDDVIVGAIGADTDGNTRTAEGAAYVIYGRQGTEGVTTIDTSSLAPGDGFRILGVDPDGRLGWSVAGVGDVNDDGTDDLIVAADKADGDSGGTDVGEVYLIFGRNTVADQTDPAGTTSYDDPFSGIDLASLAAADGIRFVGIDSSDFAGRNVSASGDVNGDGLTDILIGTNRGDGNTSADSQAGEAYLIFGRTTWSGITIDLGSLSAEDGVVIFGAEAGDRAGDEVSAAGDINRDGYDDILIGAWGADSAYILFGRNFSLDDPTDTMDLLV